MREFIGSGVERVSRFREFPQIKVRFVEPPKPTPGMGVLPRCYIAENAPPIHRRYNA